MKPVIEGAPGLKWRKHANAREAIWRARADLIKRGYAPKNVRLWKGVELTEIDRLWIVDRCNACQNDMLLWSRGGLPGNLPTFNGTLRSLIAHYQTDRDSPYQRLRYGTRINYDRMLARISAQRGATPLADIKARLVIAWHKEWGDGGKVTMAHELVGHLRTLFGFGATILEDPECERLRGVLHIMRFKMPKPREERMTAEQATALRAKAHEKGFHSMALAQALQFELMLRQKDVIGEWIPVKEPGASDILNPKRGLKWMTGLRWSEINERLILRHTTSKRQKDIQVDLKLAPMVLDELEHIPPEHRLGPVIVNEATSLPYMTTTFRLKWRQVADAAGLPLSVKNMDSRAGGISEATDAGAELEHVRHAATHSNITTTQGYSRGAAEKIACVMALRTAHRNKMKT